MEGFLIITFGTFVGVLAISYFLGEKVETPRPTMKMA